MVGVPLSKTVLAATDLDRQTDVVWRLISTWDRDDRSATAMYVWSTRRRPLRSHTRHPTDRSDRTDLGVRATAALAPVVRAHGIDAPPRPQGDSVVWCTSARVAGQDGDVGWCSDLWVHLDRWAQTIAVGLEQHGLEQHGLAEQLTGRTHWDGPIAVELDAALVVLAQHLDRLCDAAIVAE